jgi:aminoglycoside phosphotransferase (APT) family kinase protein
VNRIFLEDLATVVTIYPYDDTLAAPLQFSNSRIRGDRLRELLPDRPDLWDATVRTLHYVSNKRYVIQLKTDADPTAVLKFYNAPNFDRAAQVAARGLLSLGPLRLARQIGCSQRHGMLAYEWLEGRSMGEAVLADDLGLETMTHVGEALAELHRMDPRELITRSGIPKLKWLRSIARWIGFVFPDLAPRIDHLVHLIANRLDEQALVRSLIHGNFHRGQVLLTDQSTAILDLDTVKYADPALDLGCIMGDLELMALKGRVPSNRLGWLKHTLIDSYRSAGGQASSTSIDLYTAIDLLWLAKGPFRKRLLDWPELPIHTRLEWRRPETNIAKGVDHYLGADDRAHFLNSVTRREIPVVCLRHSLFAAWGLSMLLPPDADIVRRDIALPGLATLIDPDAFATALRSSCPQAHITRVKLGKLRYAPTRSCRAAYKVRAGGKDLRVYARAGTDDALDDPAATPTANKALNPLGSHRIVLEDLAIVVTIFPHDDILAAPWQFADPRSRKGQLRQLLPDRPDLWKSTVRTLNYLPGQRYVVQLRTDASSKAVLKFYTPSDFDLVTRVASRDLESAGSLRLARRIGCSTRHNMLAFEWLEGQGIGEAVSANELGSEIGTLIGRGLAELHRMDPKGLIGRAGRSAPTRLRSYAELIGFLCPDLAVRVDRLAGLIASRLDDQPFARCLIHGDFHASQILLTDQAVAIVDLDSVGKIGCPRNDWTPYSMGW